MKESKKNMPDDREIFILQLLVREYCFVKKPISSTYLKQRYKLDLSTATLRNIFMDLENKGFLYKEHSSSGRIPTDIAFRVYVNHLLNLNEYIEIELENIKEELEKKITDIDNVMLFSSKIITKFTKEMSFSLGITIENQIIKEIRLNKIGPGQILSLLFLESGLILDRIFFISDDIDKKILKIVENFINTFAGGKALPELEDKISNKGDLIKGELLKYKDYVDDILKKIYMVIGEFQKIHFEVYGSKDLIKNENIEDKLKTLILNVSRIDSTNVMIGKEIGEAELQEMTLITSPVKIDKDITGLLGILGPKNMYYNFNIDFIRNISDIVSGILTDKLGKWR